MMIRFYRLVLFVFCKLHALFSFSATCEAINGSFALRQCFLAHTE